MKFFVEVLVFASCAVSLIQAKNLREQDNCVVVKNGTENVAFDRTFLQLPNEMMNFRVKVQDPPTPLIEIVGSEIRVCDNGTPAVEISTEDGSYIVLRDPYLSGSGGFYQLTVYYDWAD